MPTAENEKLLKKNNEKYVSGFERKVKAIISTKLEMET